MKDNTNNQVTIESLGSAGDGIAELCGKKLFVLYTAPGDVVEVELLSNKKAHAKIKKLYTHSSKRQDPACQHFTQCGGCSLQHVKEDYYTQFKTEIVEKLLSEIGAKTTIAPLISVKEKSRRRAEFKVQYKKGQPQIGFFSAQSHQLIALEECPVCEDSITQLLPSLKECINQLSPHISSLSLTILDKGVDITIATTKNLSLNDQELLKDWAKKQSVTRISSHPVADNQYHHTFYDTQNNTITFDKVAVAIPPGAFIQASSTAQEAIITYVKKYLEQCHYIADLYAGCGCYSASLAPHCNHVWAYEGVQSMVSALHNASIANALSNKITATTRDLFKNPLKPHELQRFDGVVINPPRNGALAQIKQLQLAKVPTIVMVSCNPTTFKRDARHLIENGYELSEITPIDQFYWTPHLELVAKFEKKKGEHPK
jgi:23S rRNA (uracil1939-C5)-methyltransferase